MDWIIATGSVSLGSLIGALVSWFVNEAKLMDQKVLSSSIYIATGGGVLALFGFIAGNVPREIWLYPFGLLLGFTVITIIEIWYWGYDGKSAAAGLVKIRSGSIRRPSTANAPTEERK